MPMQSSHQIITEFSPACNNKLHSPIQLEAVALIGRILKLLCNVSALGVHVNGVKRLASHHEQAVPLFTSKT